MKFMLANRIVLDGTPRFEASHLGLFCLPMSHKKDPRLIRLNFTVNTYNMQTERLYHGVITPNDANEIAKGEDTDQTAPFGAI